MRKPRFIVSFSVPPEDQWVIDRLNVLARMEGGRRARSRYILMLLKEGIARHSHGNPQLKLMPVDPRRDKAAINFLRHRMHLPIRQISRIVDRSPPYVLKACGATGFRGRKVSLETLRIYRERFKGWMTGRYETLEEAFKP